MAQTQWEYRVLSSGSTFSQPKDNDLEGMLNELGSEGWEVVAVNNQEGTNKVRFIMKRLVTTRDGRKNNWPGY